MKFSDDKEALGAVKSIPIKKLQKAEPIVSDPAAIKGIDHNKLVIDTSVFRDRKYDVFIATPCYGGMLTDQYFLSLFRAMQEFAKIGLNFRITTLRNESLIPRARNIMTAMFLESTATHFLFIDADIEFEPDAIIRMLAMDKPIIAGAYPKKTLPIDYAINLKYTDMDKRQVRVENGAVEVLDASTGFFMVKREVFERMIQAYPELHYKNDSSIDPKFNPYCYSFFDCVHDPLDNRYLSEDYTFCRRAQAIGIDIWLDPNTKLNHVGSYTFEGDVSKLFSNMIKQDSSSAGKAVNQVRGIPISIKTRGTPGVVEVKFD